MSWFDDVTGRRKTAMITPDQALPGRTTPRRISGIHAVNGHRMTPPFPAGMETLVVAEGCFWGAERGFWQTEGVYSTAVGYAGGYTPNPTYEEVCTGMTGHTEVVLVVFDPAAVDLERILQKFWESHDPTQGMRQGNDVGSQYRSAIYTVGDDQHEVVAASAEKYQHALTSAGLGTITTEIAPLKAFYYAEEYHQQYLHKNPGGYCGIGGTGVSCPTGFSV
ncbi:peptide-methionine (S)-S-oxide reductase MsrA [Hoyosella rhizosphaerae]|nr:peptide-methionine (S)-S-oxide reductase MsrA [Hoyosella rhizosphaerae]MBN4927424.1 peptide-methionine (S)-S-oxide reductase MsrA [Hoyosella rhizosphaerae]